MNILITGSNGFIGKNLQVALSAQTQAALLLFDLPQTLDDLETLVHRADIIFHMAGVNRPLDPDEFKSGNTDLTASLLEMLARDNRNMPFVLSSSTQAALDNPYGKSKKESEDLVFAYAKKNNAPVYVYRFPNVFGKWCKPDYNSVVATFCHNAANNIPLRVDGPAKEITLLYIDDIIEEFQRIIDGRVSPERDGILSVSPVYSITLGDLADRITRFADSRRVLMLPHDISDAFTRKLYATFSSYVAADDFVIKALMKQDERGFFAELIKSPHFGQISISRTNPGVTRGDHWHNSKAEKFVVIEGDAVIRLRKIGTEEIVEYPVSGKELRIVDLPAGYTHNIQNTGDTDLLTIIWAGDIFDPEKPDTIPEKV